MKFKNEFGITCSDPFLMEAFMKAVEAIGWKPQDEFTSGFNQLFFNGPKETIDLKEGHYWIGSFHNKLAFTLPEQWNEAIEAAKEQLEAPEVLLTDEDELYYGAEKGIVNIGEIYYYILEGSSSMGDVYRVGFKSISENKSEILVYKRFKTEKAVEDYVSLQKAIKESGLTIGKRGSDVDGIFERRRYKALSWGDKDFSYNFSDDSAYRVLKFMMVENTPCVIVNNTETFENIGYAFPLEQFKNKRVKIGSYTSEIIETGENDQLEKAIAFGCQSFNLENLDFLQRMISPPINAEIKIGETDITDELITSLRNLLK